MAEREILLIGVVIALAAAAGTVAHLLRIPQSAAAVGAGLLARAFLPEDPLLEALLLVALALLLFAAGTRFSTLRHEGASRAAVAVGLVPVIVVGGAAAIAASLAGWRLGTLPYVAATAGFASTLLALEWLHVRRDEQETTKRALLVALLAQDALALALLVLLPAEDPLAPAPFLALGALALAAAALAWAGRQPRTWRLLPDDEARVLGVLGVAFGAMLLAASLGVPFVVGAFVAGFGVALHPARVHARPAVRAAEEFFTPVFLVTLGLLFPLPAREHWPLLAALVALVLLLKPLVVAVVGRLARLPTRQSALAGAASAQSSEFAVPLVMAGAAVGALRADETAVLGGLVALTLLLSPVARAPLARILTWALPDDAPPPDAPTKGHVVVLGAGVTGRAVAVRLAQRGTPVLAVDADPESFEALDPRVPRLAGDATRAEVLEAAGVARATAVIVLLRRDEAALRALDALRDLMPAGAHVVVRARDAARVRDAAPEDAVIVSEDEATAREVARRLAPARAP